MNNFSLPIFISKLISDQYSEYSNVFILYHKRFLGKVWRHVDSDILLTWIKKYITRQLFRIVNSMNDI